MATLVSHLLLFTSKYIKTSLAFHVNLFNIFERFKRLMKWPYYLTEYMHIDACEKI